MLNSCCRYRKSLSTVAAVHPKVGSSVEQVPKTFPVEFKPTSIPQITYFKRNNVSVLSALSVANLSVSEDHSKTLNIRSVEDNSRIIDEFTKYYKSPHLITQSGADLAEQFVVKYPRSFTMRFSDEMNSGRTVPQGVFEDLCAKQNCSDAWKLYKDSKQKGIEISIEDQHRLLDLFCFHGYKNIIKKTLCDTDMSDRKEEHKTQSSGYTYNFYLPQKYQFAEQKSIWHKKCPASDVLQSITEQECHTEFTYCTAIQSMVKFHKENLAWNLYKDMREKGFKPNTATYSALMCGLSKRDDLWDNDDIFNLMKDMMSEPVVRPDGDFFYHMLNNGEADSFRDIPAEVSKKCKILDEFNISNIDIEFPTVAHIITMLFNKNYGIELGLKLLDWLLVEQQDRLIPSFHESQHENLLCVLAKELSQRYESKHQVLLLEYIRNKKLLKYFGTHDVTELNINRLSFLPIGKARASGYWVSKELYYNHTLKYDLSHQSQLRKLITLIKAAILAKEYQELVPLYEESNKIYDTNKMEYYESEESLKVLLARISNLLFLGIRDAYLRNDVESAHHMRALAHRTFSNLTSNEFVPNPTALLVIIVINFYTGHYKDALELMDTLYSKYRIPVPYSVILGSLRLVISRGNHIICEPTEWSELSPGIQKHLRQMLMSFDYEDFNYGRNWAAIRAVVSNLDLGED